MEHFIKHQSLGIVACAAVLAVLYIGMLKLTSPSQKVSES
jgi:hypothetical protein